MASSTSPAPGLGSGSSSSVSVSGPPTRRLNIAFIVWYLPGYRCRVAGTLELTETGAGVDDFGAVACGAPWQPVAARTWKLCATRLWRVRRLGLGEEHGNADR